MNYVMVTAAADVTRILRDEPQEPSLGPGEAQAIAVDAMPAIPPRPAGATVLRWIAGALAWADTRTLAEQKADRRKELRAAAAANARRTITVQGTEFAADDEALADLAREAFFARIDGAAFTLTWQRASGAFVTLTDAQTIGLARAIRDRAEAIRQQLRDKLQAVTAAATAAEVAAVAWSLL